MATGKFVVSGLVQGVGFRVAVSRCANTLGLSGYIRNNPDGTVTAVADGSEEKLSLFELMLRDGCGSLARVDEVKKTLTDEALTDPSFRVR